MKNINKLVQPKHQDKLGINLFLGLALLVGLIAVGGCNSSGGNTAGTQNNGDKTKPAAPQNAEPATSIVKPGDVSPDKALKVIELIDSVAADKAAWKGKEVVVTGFVSGTSNSGKRQLVTLTNDKDATNKKGVTCGFEGVTPDGIVAKTIEVKGKIEFANTDGEFKSINLDPCEIKK